MATGIAAPRLPAWRVIWTLIRLRPKLWLLNLGAMIVLMLFAQAPGLIVRAFLDQLTDGAQAGFGVWTLVAFLFASQLGERLGVVGLFLTNVPFFVHSMTLLRRNLLAHILRRPGASALPDSPGEALSRFKGDVFELPLFALWLNDLLGLVVFAIVAVTVMVHINAGITLLAVLPFIAVGVVANLTSRQVERYRRASRTHAGIVTGFIGELFGAAQAVKTATAEGHAIAHFRKLNAQRGVIAVRDRLFNEILNSIFRNATNLGTGIILILAGRAMQQHTFTVGDFALFVFYLDFISELTAFSGLLVARYRQISVSVERMQRLMEGAPAGALIEPQPTHLDGTLPEVRYATRAEVPAFETLAVSELSFRFPTSGRGIEGVSFRLRRGEFVVITGRNGAGKTTLLRVLLGLLPKADGRIAWNEREVDDPGRFFVPPVAAYTAQIPRLFSDSLRDNILMGLPADDATVARAVRAAVLEADLSRLEDGLETRVGPKGVKLSGGQLQRSAAARMFAREPELLVFDDLSSALDVETEKLLWERAFEREGTTCLVVSHRKAALRRADQVIVLNEGRIEAAGPLAEVLERSPELRRIWYGTEADARIS